MFSLSPEDILENELAEELRLFSATQFLSAYLDVLDNPNTESE